MRRARPPRFISSPASMKNGTAISGKLSAPLMMFWATICESNTFSECISVTQGPPARGCDQVCSFAFLHRNQVFLGCPTTQHAKEIEQQDHRRGDAEDEAGGVEEQADRDAGCRRAVAEGQHRLLPAPPRQKPVGVEHQEIADDKADLLAEGRQRA